MPKQQRRMHLVAYLKTGPTANHGGGWRHPASALDDIFEPERYEQLARVLEAGRFDAGFFADTFGIPDLHGNHFRTYLQLGGQISYLDPLTVLPYMARVTTRLGLGATLSTTFQTPYYLARTLASLDLLSKGRIAWNVVTSATDLEARNSASTAFRPRKNVTIAPTRCWKRAARCGIAGRKTPWSSIENAACSSMRRR